MILVIVIIVVISILHNYNTPKINLYCNDIDTDNPAEQQDLQYCWTDSH